MTGPIMPSGKHSFSNTRLKQWAYKKLAASPMVNRIAVRIENGLQNLRFRMLMLSGRETFNTTVTGEDLEKLAALVKSEKNYKEILDQLPDMVYIHTMEGEFRWVNKIAQKKIGFSSEGTLSISDLLTQESLEYAVRQVAKAKKARKIPTLEFTLKSGMEIEVRGILIEHEGEECILAISRDITQRKQTERVIAAVLEIDQWISEGTKLDKILQLIADKAVEVLPFIDKCSIQIPNLNDGSLGVAALSEGFPREYGKRKKRKLSTRAYEESKILVTNYAQSFGTSAGEDVRSALYAGLEVKARGSTGEETDRLGEISMYSCSENVFTSEELVELSSDDIKGSAYLSLVKMFLDRAAAAIRTAKMATTDFLTGLPTAEVFASELLVAVKRSMEDKSPISILIPDIDKFKAANDTFGNTPHGDNIIKRFANIILQNVYKRDFVARLGGDEFGDLLRNTTRDEAMLAAERLLEAVENEEIVVSAEVRQRKIKKGIKDGLIYKRMVREGVHVIGLKASIGGITIPSELFDMIDLNKPEVKVKEDELARVIIEKAMNLAFLASKQAKDRAGKRIIIAGGEKLMSAVQQILDSRNNSNE